MNENSISLVCGGFNSGDLPANVAQHEEPHLLHVTCGLRPTGRASTAAEAFPSDGGHQPRLMVELDSGRMIAVFALTDASHFVADAPATPRGDQILDYGKPSWEDLRV